MNGSIQGSGTLVDGIILEHCRECNESQTEARLLDGIGRWEGEVVAVCNECGGQNPVA